MNKFTAFLNDESGATAIEYGLIAALVAVVLITVLTKLGTQLDAKFNDIASAISGSGAAPSGN